MAGAVGGVWGRFFVPNGGSLRVDRTTLKKRHQQYSMETNLMILAMTGQGVAEPLQE